MNSFLFRDESFKIRGACFEVYREKGCGFTESVYQECLEIEMSLRGIPYDSQFQVPLAYKGRNLSQKFVPDLICFGKVVVELKAVSNLVDEHRAQIINYLKATGFELGLLVNFGHFPKIEIERFLNSSAHGVVDQVSDKC